MPLRPLLAFSVLMIAPAAQASEKFREIETKYLFGFTEGTDIGAEGEREFEMETNGRYQMKAGRYSATEQEFAFEHVPSQYWMYEFNVHMSSHQISGVPGLADRSYSNFSGLSLKPKWLVIGRGPGDPVGLSVSVEPEWEKIDGTTGAHARNFNSKLKIAADTELVPDRLYAGMNLIYQPEWVRENGVAGWAHESGYGVTGAVSYRVTPTVALGGEVEYYRAFRGLAFNAYGGEAVFAGPTAYVLLTPKIFLAAAWSAQVAGHAAGDAAQLDLTNFQRQRVNFKFGVEF